MERSRKINRAFNEDNYNIDFSFILLKLQRKTYKYIIHEMFK